MLVPLYYADDKVLGSVTLNYGYRTTFHSGKVWSSNVIGADVSKRLKKVVAEMAIMLRGRSNRDGIVCMVQ